MSNELALLRAIAFNPYNDTIRGAYADWLQENGRVEEASQVRTTFLRSPDLPPANSMTNAELIGKLLSFPLDAAVIYDCFSDYATLMPDEVTLIKAEEKRVVYREQNGYMRYDLRWWGELGADRLAWCHTSPIKGEVPDFRTVVHFPGN